MLVSRGVISVMLCYSITMIPACQQTRSQDAAILSHPDAKTSYESLQKKSPSELKKLLLSTQIKLFNSLAKAKVSIVDANSLSVSQSELEKNPENLSKYFFKVAENLQIDSVAYKMTSDFSQLEEKSTVTFNLSAYEVNSLGKIVGFDTQETLVPAKEIAINLTQSFDDTINNLDRTFKSFARQVAVKVAKPGVDLGAAKKPSAKFDIFNLFETSAYAQKVEKDVTATTLLFGILLGVCGFVLMSGAYYMISPEEIKTWSGGKFRGSRIGTLAMAAGAVSLVIAASCITYGLLYEVREPG